MTEGSGQSTFIEVSALKQILKGYFENEAVLEKLTGEIYQKAMSANHLLKDMGMDPKRLVDEVTRELGALGLLPKGYSKSSDLRPEDYASIIRRIKPEGWEDV